jgi:hypothetical protein
MVKAEAQAQTAAEIQEVGQLEQDSFFTRTDDVPTD